MKKTSHVKVQYVQPLFHNGDRVKDTVSQMTGIVVAVTLWRNGCIRYVVQAEGYDKKEGKPYDGVSFDQADLLLVKAGAIPVVHQLMVDISPEDIEKEAPQLTGGPHRDNRAALRRQ